MYPLKPCLSNQHQILTQLHFFPLKRQTWESNLQAKLAEVTIQAQMYTYRCVYIYTEISQEPVCRKAK